MDRRFQYVRKRLLRFILPGLRQLPPRWSAGLVGGFGPIEYAINGGLRSRYHEVLGQAARHFGADWDIPSVSVQLSRNLARWMTRDLLLDGWPDSHVNAMFEVEGRNRLDRALAHGKGVVLLFSHLGAHVHPTHWLMRQGYTVRWFSERPKLLSRYIQRDFETDGPTGQQKMFISRRSGPSESATAFLRAKRALNAGLIVKAAGDVRWVGARTASGEFLGRTYSFTTPWVSLAALSGAPVVPVFCLMNQDGTFRITFEEPFGVPKQAREVGQTEPWLRRHLRSLEGWLREHPDNSNDYFFWYENDDCVVEEGPAGEVVAA
ncbi:MAG: lauroyl acyltransferase [Isosphaeraceae bacterium]